MPPLATPMRHIVRGLARRRIATVSSIASLTLGVASVTLVFGVAKSLLFSPLPGVERDPLRIEGVGGTSQVRVVSYPEFRAIQGALAGIATVVGSRTNTAPVRIESRTDMATAAAVTEEYFRGLGVAMTVGRAPMGSESFEAVISYGLWERALGADPGVLGARLRIRDVDYTIVGVTDPTFEGTFPGFQVQVWVGIETLPRIFPGDGSLDEVGDRFINVLAVPNEDATATEIVARLEPLSERLSQTDDWPPGRRFQVASSRGVHPSLKPPVRTIVVGLGAVALIVLFLACANLGILALAQGAERRAQYGLLAALGASRTRILLRPLSEAATLGVLAWVPAAALARGATVLLAQIATPSGPPLKLPIRTDGSIMAFALLAGVLSSVVFSAPPAWRASGVSGIRHGSRQALGPGARSRGVFQSALVAGQAGGTCLLLVAATLLLRSVANLNRLDPGFDRDRIVTVTAEIEGFPEGRGRAFWRELYEATLGIHGVEQVALGLFPHLGGRSDRAEVNPQRHDSGARHSVHYSIVGPGYFQALGIAQSSGTAFAQDGSPDAAVVNEVLAARLWPGEGAVGQTLAVALRGTVRTLTVTGVVETVKYRRFNEQPTPFLYLPTAGWYRPDQTLHVRVSGDPRASARVLQERLSGLDPDVPVQVLPMSDLSTMEVNLARVLRAILTICGTGAMMVSAVGVVGVTAYATTTRSKEMAVRRVLGATRGGAIWTVISRTAAALTLGGMLGALAFVPAGRVLGAFLFGVSTNDTVALLTVPAGLTVFGLATAFWTGYQTSTQGIEASLRGD